MNQKNKILFFVGFPVTLLLGIVIGRIIKDFPLIAWDNKVSFTSALSLIVTVGIGVMIPFFVKKLIDDNRGIKCFLVDEIKDLIIIVSKIRDIISSAYSVSKFEVSDRDKIIYQFHAAQLKVDSIEDQLKISFKKQSPKLVAELKSCLSAYKEYLTDGEMMVSTFNKITDHFYKESSNEYSKIETGFKKTIHRIHKF